MDPGSVCASFECEIVECFHIDMAFPFFDDTECSQCRRCAICMNREHCMKETTTGGDL